MSTYVALLRGVNVGGRNTLAMAALRELFESLGHGEVRTLIQSGNVIFTSARPPVCARLKAAIESRFGFSAAVVVRSVSELHHVVVNNPLIDADGSTLHLGFMAGPPAAADVASLDHERYAPEQFAVVGAACYLLLPGGVGRSKLPDYLSRRLKVPITLRNWKTVTALAALADQ